MVKIADKIAYLGRDIEDARAYHILDMSAYRELRAVGVLQELAVEPSAFARLLSEAFGYETFSERW